MQAPCLILVGHPRKIREHLEKILVVPGASSIIPQVYASHRLLSGLCRMLLKLLRGPCPLLEEGGWADTLTVRKVSHFPVYWPFRSKHQTFGTGSSFSHEVLRQAMSRIVAAPFSRTCRKRRRERCFQDATFTSCETV